MGALGGRQRAAGRAAGPVARTGHAVWGSQAWNLEPGKSPLGSLPGPLSVSLGCLVSPSPGFCSLPLAIIPVWSWPAGWAHPSA